MNASKKYIFPVSVCLSSKCNRNCSHCSASATMDGCFFPVEYARILADEVRRLREDFKEHQNMDVRPWLHFTGDGEALLNPNFVEIHDLLLGTFEDTKSWMVSSGVDSKSPEEENRLQAVLSKPYFQRLAISLSFNLFQKGFPKRFIQTAKLLFQNGVEEIGVKICLTDMDVNKALWKLNLLIVNYFIKWARELKPLASIGETFTVSSQTKHLEEMLSAIVPPGRMKEKKKEAQGRVTMALKNARPPSRFDLEVLKTIFLANYPWKISFETSYGLRKIRIMPMFLTKRGRARELLNLDWELNQPIYPCDYVLNQERYGPLHLSAEGDYYPTCECPKLESLRLGNIHDRLGLVCGRWHDLRKVLFRHIVADCRTYKDVCTHCGWIAAKPEIQEILHAEK